MAGIMRIYALLPLGGGGRRRDDRPHAQRLLPQAWSGDPPQLPTHPPDQRCWAGHHGALDLLLRLQRRIPPPGVREDEGGVIGSTEMSPDAGDGARGPVATASGGGAGGRTGTPPPPDCCHAQYPYGHSPKHQNRNFLCSVSDGGV